MSVALRVSAAVLGAVASFACAVVACSSSSDGASAPDASSDAVVDTAAPDAAADAGADSLADAAPDACADAGIPPNDLYCTGLYSDWASKTIAPDVTAYTPGLVFWSDGAIKDRWIQLPPGATIDTSNMDEWVFPLGTKIWKQFTVGGKIVETRLMWKADAIDWTFVVYRWKPDGSAKRLETGETNVEGTTYEIPSTLACPTCHKGRLDKVLGVDLLGTGLASARGVTLASLLAANRLTNAPPATTIAIPEDATHKAAAALGWFHVNCGSSCHNRNSIAPGAGTRLFFKLRADQLFPDGGSAQVADLDSYTTSVNVAANLHPGGANYLRIAPHDAGASLVPIMASTRDADAGFKPMPPLVSHIVDTTGVALTTDWIGGL